MSYKSWFFSTLFLILFSLLLIGAFNWYIDPHWCFSPDHKYNQVQVAYDERAQKTNYVTFRPFSYDALLLGSSRVTYINQHDFRGLKVYNYAVSNMLPEEYYDYIEYAKKRNGRDFDCIIIGLDFWTTNRNKELPSPIKEPRFYIGKARSFNYRYKVLFSYDTCKLALKNFRASRGGIPMEYFYDRHNVKHLLPLAKEERDKKIDNALSIYRDKLYRDYEYVSYKGLFEKLKKANPHTRFIVFTTPESLPLMQLLAEEGLMPYYERWLKENVEVFGEVYHFMYPNPVTLNLDNYYDASHFYPHVGTFIACRIMGIEDKNMPGGFGIVLGRNNVDSKIEKMKAEILSAGEEKGRGE